MPYPGEYYEPELIRLMSQALKEARAELRASGMEDGPAEHAIMAMHVMKSACAGERNQTRLVRVALHAVDGRNIEDDAR